MCLVTLLLALQVTALVAAPYATPFEFRPGHPPGEAHMGVRLLGAVRLGAGDAGAPRQLSGLAWDADADLLYAVSDEGYLAHLEPHFDADRLVAVRLRGVFPLRDAADAPLRRPHSDAEGLTARHARNGVAGDTELVVSFEVRPRLARYTPEGRLLGPAPTPPLLTQDHVYADPNRQLEALTETAQHGLVTGPERPLVISQRGQISLQASSGMHWRYPLADADHGALVGLETLPGDALLVLERRYVSPLSPLVITLSRTVLDAPAGALLAAREIARFDSTGGFAVDNFEGVAHHEQRRYFMISDDNRWIFQRTVLVYFELLEDVP